MREALKTSATIAGTCTFIAQVGDQGSRRRRHEILDGLDAVEADGQRHVGAPLLASLAIGFIELKSISAPTANPATPSEPSASLPPRAFSRAGLPPCFS